jgi:hypothetical protein
MYISTPPYVFLDRDNARPVRKESKCDVTGSFASTENVVMFSASEMALVVVYYPDITLSSVVSVLWLLTRIRRTVPALK